MKKYRMLTLLLMLAATAAIAIAQAPTIIHFDEVPPGFTPVNGLVFNAPPSDGGPNGGITFFFNVGGVPSTDAHFGGAGPGSILFVQDPSLEGNAMGTLWILFDSPSGTPYLVFGLARSTGSALLPGAIVTLYDTNFSFITTKTLPTYPYESFSENLFNSPPNTPLIRLVRIVFPSATTAARFALDNLTYTDPKLPRSPVSNEIAAKEATIRASLAAGVDPNLEGPALPENVISQLRHAKSSGDRQPGPWSLRP